MCITAVVGCFFFSFFLQLTVPFMEINGPCVLKRPRRSLREWALYMRNVCRCKHHLTLFIKPQGGLVTHSLPHPQDVHLSLIRRPRTNQGGITKLLVIFEHFEMEYKCLFKGPVLISLGWFGGIFILKAAGVLGPQDESAHVSGEVWVSQRSNLLFVCLLTNGK